MSLCINQGSCLNTAVKLRAEVDDDTRNVNRVEQNSTYPD